MGKFLKIGDKVKILTLDRYSTPSMQEYLGKTLVIAGLDMDGYIIIGVDVITNDGSTRYFDINSVKLVKKIRLG